VSRSDAERVPEAPLLHHKHGNAMRPQPLTLLLSTILLAHFCAAVPSAHAQPKGLIFAHRGGGHEFEENTMAAFQQSYDAGLRGFETDVRMTKDGEFVLLHDDTLERTHQATGPVEHKTAAELRSVKSKQGEPLVFLDDLLDYLADKPDMYVEFEMKTSNKDLYPDARLDEYCRKLYDVVQARRPAGSFYVLTSFDERPLRKLKTLDPNVDLMLISSKPCDQKIVVRAQSLGVKRIGIHVEGTSRADVRAAQKAGLRVTCWPGHSLQDYHLAVGLGVDAICTDVPVAIQRWKTKAE
jgi:glycerophosphoryl diester phosphodiesterase